MPDDNYKELAKDLLNNVKLQPPKEEYRKDSVDTPTRTITDRDIKENSVQVPSKPPLERKSFSLMAAQTIVNDINKEDGE